MDGWYEWKVTGEGKAAVKQPYTLGLASGEPMAFAGLWEFWRAKEPEAEAVMTFSIVTTDAHAGIREIHDRMPVILDRAAWPAWLGEVPAEKDDLLALLQPYPADRLAWRPVSAAVGNVRNNGPEMLEPVELAVA